MSEEIAAAAADLAHVQRLTAERAMLLLIALAACNLSDEINEFGAPVAGETMNELDVALLEQFGGPDRDWLVVRGNIRAALRELEARHVSYDYVVLSSLHKYGMFSYIKIEGCLVNIFIYSLFGKMAIFR